MVKKKSKNEGKAGIQIGNISNVGRDVNISEGNITTNQNTTGLNPAEIRELFDGLYKTIERNNNVSLANKKDLQAEVKEIETTVTEAVSKSENVDEGELSRHFRNIARMAPDVLEVVVATLVNPLAGLGVAVKKIAEKAKEEIR
jgi:cell division septum initiation protein DivIVA